MRIDISDPNGCLGSVGSSILDLILKRSGLAFQFQRPLLIHAAHQRTYLLVFPDRTDQSMQLAVWDRHLELVDLTDWLSTNQCYNK